MDALSLILIAIGIGFLFANARLLLEQQKFWRRRRHAALIWASPKPPHFATALALAVVLAILVLYKSIVLRRQVFGEGMMLLYYGCLLPLSLRIRRGFYEDGVWTDSGFIAYQEIGGVTWREDKRHATLIVISRVRNLARRLAVPFEHYGAARRLLRDKIKAHDIQFTGTGLDLGEHDERSVV
jgi:hypothetical protein